MGTSAPNLKQQLTHRIPAEIDKSVAQDIAEFMQQTGWDWWCVFLNNFLFHLPGGAYRRFPNVIRNAPCRDERASKIRRSLTIAQFHEVVDRFIRELGLDDEKIRRHMEMDEVEELYVYIIPLYVRLRAEGFKRYPDLTA